MFILAETPQLAVPVGDTQVSLDKSLTHGAISEHSVEEGLRNDGMNDIHSCTTVRSPSLSFTHPPSLPPSLPPSPSLPPPSLPHLGWEEGKAEVELEVHQEGIPVGDQISGVVPMNSYPVAAPVNAEVRGEGPRVHTPHVVVALHKGAVQTLLLDESMYVWRRGLIEKAEERQRGLTSSSHLRESLRSSSRDAHAETSPVPR